MTGELFPILEAVGTAAFAMSGAFKAIRHRLDLLGVLVLGFSTALGGGLMRDALLHETPVAFTRLGPALWSLVGCVLATAWDLAAPPRRSPTALAEGKVFLVVDGIGLAVFAATGAKLGAEAGLNAFGVVLLSALTGAGGGVLRDLLVREVPLVLRADFYATAALFGGVLYAVLDLVSSPWRVAAAFSATFFLRLMAIGWGWRLPRLPRR